MNENKLDNSIEIEDLPGEIISEENIPPEKEGHRDREEVYVDNDDNKKVRVFPGDISTTYVPAGTTFKGITTKENGKSK